MDPKSNQAPERLLRVFAELLASSAETPLGALTRRRTYGPSLFPGKATAVIGMRRAGKTTFLHQLRGEQASAGVSLERLPYISFEDERLTGLDASSLDGLLSVHRRRVADEPADAGVRWHFDEIQVVPGWERFVRRLLDNEGAEVVVTGSSAALLSKEIATALRGRAWKVLMHPFSFEEVLRHQNMAVPAPEALAGLSARSRARLERALQGWLQAGGFPEAQGLDVETRHRLLRDYVDVAMLRDVMERHEVRNATGLRWLVRHLLSNAAASFSVEKFHAALRSQGVSISRDTVHQLLAHLVDCFLVRVVWMESSSERQRLVNPRKAYPADAGLIPVFDRSGRANTGHALETAVLVELERRGLDITYVRTDEGFEVDFLARSASGEMELIQVCADSSDPATAEREMRALAAAGERFPAARRSLLTLTRDGLPRETPAGVTAMPAYEWFLAPSDRLE